MTTLRCTAVGIGVGLMLTGTLGCVGLDTDDEPDETEATGVEMTIDLHEKVEAEGIRFSIYQCGEDEPEYVEEQSLEDATLPDAIPEFAGAPFDEDSEHLFANHRQVVEAGCYDVTIEPVDQQGELVDQCEAASAEDVEVTEGETTDLLLVSQCETPDDKKEDVLPELPEDAELDVVGAVNPPPEIKSVEARPSADLECPATLELCADVVEPDQDPVVFDWVILEGPEPTAGPVETVFEEDNGKWHKCVEWELPDETADYLFELTVFDRFIIDGEPVEIEDWYRDQGYDDVESRDTITVPVSVDCPDEEDVLPIIEDKKDKKDKKDEKDKEDKNDDKDKKQKKEDDKKDEKDEKDNGDYGE